MLNFWSHHYRGSDQGKMYIWPFPYFKYEGEVIEAETAYVRGTFYKGEKLTLKLSFNVGLSVESKGNKAREGMPELNYTFEAGPMMIYNLWENLDQTYKLTFEMPIRQVHSVDLFSIEPVGFFSIPYLNFVRKPSESFYNWGFELSIGVMYGSRKYHDYFYTVQPQYQRLDRKAYAAKGGYSGTQLALILSKQWEHFLMIPFVRYDILKGVVFRDSPLFKKEYYMALGLASFYTF